MQYSKQSFFILLLVIITLLNIYDFYNDLKEYEHDLVHLWIEGIIILVSMSGISYLIMEIRQHRLKVEQLDTQLSITRTDLHNTRADLTELEQKMRQASQQYSKVIQEQFTAWEFTPSEKEVALLLLKGLSFDEIAGIRATKEKTVRQQATAVYRKSNLNGRHAFAAWFFEDFLQ